MQWTKNKIWVFLYLFLVNLPLLVVTFHTPNWSDDYQYANLLNFKAKFTPLSDLIFNEIGGHSGAAHMVPVYILFNLLITSISLSPIFFHFVIMILYVSTGFFIYLIVEKYYKDEKTALLAGTLFLVNYYTAFKAATWNIFHAHATNAFTGTVSFYLLLSYFLDKKPRFLWLSSIFFLLTIFNFESGFVFYPTLMLMTFYFWRKRIIDLKKAAIVIVVFSMLFALYPLACQLKMGKAVPLSERFGSTKNIQNYAYNSLELFYKSTGLSLIYNKFIFNKLKENPDLKESVIKLVRENDSNALKEIAPLHLLAMGAVVIMTVILAIFLLIMIVTRIRQETRLFVYSLACLFIIYNVIFYRTDVANAIAVISSIVMADILISLLRDSNQLLRRVGIGLLTLYIGVTIWSIAERFDDCYQKSYYGLTKIAVNGSQKIYDDINQKVGHFVTKGMIWFTHDHSMYHRTIGFERIGDIIGIGDYLCYNATIFSQEALKTNIVREFKDKTLNDLVQKFNYDPRNKRIFVSSKREAEDYIKKNNINLDENEVIYISKDYQVEKLSR